MSLPRRLLQIVVRVTDTFAVRGIGRRGTAHGEVVRRAVPGERATVNATMASWRFSSTVTARGTVLQGNKRSVVPLSATKTSSVAANLATAEAAVTNFLGPWRSKNNIISPSAGSILEIIDAQCAANSPWTVIGSVKGAVETQVAVRIFRSHRALTAGVPHRAVSLVGKRAYAAVRQIMASSSPRWSWKTFSQR